MTKTTLLKAATIVFSFGMMGLFVAYRMGAFEKKSAPQTEISVPLDQTELSKDYNPDSYSDHEPDSLNKSQSVSSPVTEKTTKTDPPINLEQPDNTGLPKNWQIMAGSKTMVIIDPPINMENFSSPMTSLDSIKKPQ